MALARPMFNLYIHGPEAGLWDQGGYPHYDTRESPLSFFFFGGGGLVFGQPFLLYQLRWIPFPAATRSGYGSKDRIFWSMCPRAPFWLHIFDPPLTDGSLKGLSYRKFYRNTADLGCFGANQVTVSSQDTKQWEVEYSLREVRTATIRQADPPSARWDPAAAKGVRRTNVRRWSHLRVSFCPS